MLWCLSILYSSILTNNIMLYDYANFIYSLAYKCLKLFNYLATINNSAHLCTSFWVKICFHFPWEYTQEWNCCAYGNSVLNILSNCWKIFQNTCTKVHFHQQDMRNHISPYSCHHLLFSIF